MKRQKNGCLGKLAQFSTIVDYSRFTKAPYMYLLQVAPLVLFFNFTLWRPPGDFLLKKTLTFHLPAKVAPVGSRLLSSKVGPSSTIPYKYLPKWVLLSCVRTLGHRWSSHSRTQTLKFCNLCLEILLLQKPNAPSNIENEVAI